MSDAKKTVLQREVIAENNCEIGVRWARTFVAIALLAVSLTTSKGTEFDLLYFCGGAVLAVGWRFVPVLKIENTIARNMWMIIYGLLALLITIIVVKSAILSNTSWIFAAIFGVNSIVTPIIDVVSDFCARKLAKNKIH